MSRRAVVASRWRTLREVLGERDLSRLHVTVGLWATADAAFLLAATVTADSLGDAPAVDAFVHLVTDHAPTDAWAETAVSGLLAEDERRTRPAHGG